MIRYLTIIIFGALFLLGACAATPPQKSSTKAGLKNAKARLGYVQSKSTDIDFKKFDYQFSMDMKSSIQVEKEDRQMFDLCKLYAGQLIPLENMLDTCSAAIETPGISTRTQKASYYNRGLIHQKLDQLSEAQSDFEKSITLDSNFGDGYLALASLNMLENNPQIARQNIETALTKKVRHPAYAHYLLGHALEADSKFIEARSEYRRALELRPNWRDAIRRIDRINISWPE